MPDARFTEACGFVMPFGAHKGKTIARIGANAEGLRYLDWLVGKPWLKASARSAIETYLGRPAIASQLDAALDD